MFDARRLIACAAIIAAIFVGCAKRPALTGVAAPAPTGGAEVQAAPGPVAAAPAAPTPVTPAPAAVRPVPKDFAAIDALRPIYFDFDRSDIRPGDKVILNANAKWLKDNTNQLVLIEGHCDERGTNEYNLGLGDRRARSTMNYLVSQGVQATRITIISYGEERPQCTEKTEACWAKNRRSHFLVKQG
jgi:peptidoglycan-associated lipoprotein